MALRITVDVFSGRPNPVITLDDEADREVVERLRPAERLERDEAQPPPESILGYRGIVVEQIDSKPLEGLPERFRIVDAKLLGAKLAQRPADPGVEDFILASSGPIRLARLDHLPRIYGRRRFSAQPYIRGK